MRKNGMKVALSKGKNVVLMPFHMIFGDAFSYISEGAFMPRFIYSHCIPSIYASLFFFENHSISSANIHSLSYWLGYFESSVNFSVWLEFTVWHSNFKWHFCKHFYAGSILHLNHQGWILFFSEIELGCKLPISKHRGSCYGLKQLCICICFAFRNSFLFYHIQPNAGGVYPFQRMVQLRITSTENISMKTFAKLKVW